MDWGRSPKRMTELLRQPLPLGRSDFAALRHDGCIYVDKTAQIFELCRDSSKVFLSRPRRFGKSLLVSAFESLFKNGLRDFKGLQIESLWNDRTYNVVRLDFSEIKDYSSEADFSSKFEDLLIRKFRQVGFRHEAGGGLLMGQISTWLSLLPSSSLVVLIDEYDAPLTASLEDDEMFGRIRAVMSAFFQVLKSNEGCLRFFFMTGITKYRQTSIFSEFNFFDDISLNSEYGTLIGYTEEEIRTCFTFHVEEARQKLGLTEPELLRKLRLNYDGFSFDQAAAAHVYWPWSVLNFFKYPQQGFRNYWYESGGQPALLLKYLKRHVLSSPDRFDEPISISIDELYAAREVKNLSDAVLLSQAGYLTIKSQLNFAEVELGYPNQEVRLSIARLYADEMLRSANRLEIGVSRLAKMLDTESAEVIVKHFNAVLNAIDYQRYPIRDEASCRSHMQVLLMGAAMATDVEKHSALGRSDLEVRTDHRHWVFEFKFAKRGADAQKLLAAAIAQSSSRRYGTEQNGKKLCRLALVFDQETRCFSAWEAF